MKIAAPISSVQEVDMLLHFGADELYCGIRTPEWDEHFGGKWWMNRRSPRGANVGSWQDMQTLVGKARSAGVAVHVTLNAPFYTEGSIRYLLRLTERLVNELSVDGVIVSDLNFILRLAREDFPLRLHLSSLGACINSYTVEFYHSLGIRRIILPRQLTLSEIQEIVTHKTADMEFEVFAVNDGCFFEEGFCQTLHALGGPFCLTNWAVEPRGAVIESDRLNQCLAELRDYLWYQNNCGSSFQEDGLPNGPCSLCWFGRFRDWGVTAVKIVGREASFFRKMRSLQLVKAVMDRTCQEAGCREIEELARALRRTPEYCEKGYMCYFRDR
jgi:putative protease